MRITVQVFQNGEAQGEYIADVKEAKTEIEAVDTLLKHLRIDLLYRFLGMHGIVNPSIPDYMVMV